MKKKIALIFGVTGQDGYYLSDLLLKKNYKVHGVKRRSSSVPTKRIEKYLNNKNFFIHYGDISDGTSTLNIINKVKPHEIYNLAAQSHVRVSFDVPEYTADVTALGSLRILESIRILNLKKTKYYQASSSEMYGLVKKRNSLNELTPFHPLFIVIDGLWRVPSARRTDFRPGAQLSQLAVCIRYSGLYCVLIRIVIDRHPAPRSRRVPASLPHSRRGHAIRRAAGGVLSWKPRVPLRSF